MRVVAFVLTTFLILIPWHLPAAQAQGNKSFLWKTESRSATVYLLGSVHVGREDMYPLADVIEDAFDESSHLVVEADIEKLDPIAMLQEVMALGIYKGEKQLLDHISNDTLIKLTKYLKKYNLPLAQVSNFKPWFLMMTLSALQIRELGYDETLGVDYYFIKKARDNKEILELEGVTQQLKIFDDMPDQDLFLNASLDSFHELEEQMEPMIEAWKKGDTKIINNIMIEDMLEDNPQQALFYEKVFFERNRDMTDKILKYLKTNNVYFVVVGAGHLVGDRSIVGLLRKQGFRVTQQGGR